MLSRPADAPQARRRYIDWARGVAVVVMIEAHTIDAWTRRIDRSSSPFGYLMLVGGLAAPLFLWLAGLGAALAVERARDRDPSGSRWHAAEGVVRRGLEIFILAFLFRLQAFIVSPGSPLVTIFRVDILNVMGPAIALAGVVSGLSRSRAHTVLVNGLVAVGIAMVTPIVRGAPGVGMLPTWFQWYLRPTGDHTTFTLLPWSGFVFAGAACGTVLAAPVEKEAERWRVGLLAAAGALLVCLGHYTALMPSIYRSSSFWTSSPTYFAIRTGIVMLILAALFAATPIARATPRPFGWLEAMGQNSLFIYWIHVELVYGYATWVIHRRLPIWASVLACALFCALMHRSIGWRDGIVRYWRSRRSGGAAHSRTAPAGA